MTKRIPLIFFPGLAANAELFAPQRKAFTHLQVPEWPAPQAYESLKLYAKRLASGLIVPTDRPYILGGFSFGTQIAQELLQHLDPKPALLFLICAVRGRHQYTPAFLIQERLARFLPGQVQQGLYPFYAKQFAQREGLNSEQTQRLIAMGQTLDPDFFKWSAKACAEWSGPPDLPQSLPVWHLHGEQDTVIPDAHHEANHVIPDAGHLITWTHATEVNALLKEAQQVVRATS